MAFFNRLNKESISKQFTHYGLFWGCVPVYVNMRNSDCPDVATRNWIPEWVLDLSDLISSAPVYVMMILNPRYEPAFVIKLTGLIEAGR